MKKEKQMKKELTLGEPTPRAMRGAVFFAASLCLLPSVALARGDVNCDEDHPGALQAAIDASSPGDTILVSGTCNENVLIPEGKDRITLDGGGVATINGPDATVITLRVRGRGITIVGFTITGGRNGLAVTRGGTAHIAGNVIYNTGGNGIEVNQSGFAVIVNNTIQNNQMTGISVGINGGAWIGFVAGQDTVASPNYIYGNGANGILVHRSGSARIVGNFIGYNTQNGVFLQRGSVAEISDNAIDGNGQNGILVRQGSGVELGADTGNTIFTRPNSTMTNNAGFGVRCQVGGYADGRLGSLTGDSGAESYSEGCVPSLIP